MSRDRPVAIAPIRDDVSDLQAMSVAASSAPATSVAATPASAPQAPCWVALHFPALPLMVCDFPEGLPGIVIHESGGRQLVHAACPLAQDRGVMPGMSLNAAHVLCRNLVVRPRDPLVEYRRLQQDVEALQRFTPAVSLGFWRTASASTRNGPGPSGPGPDDNADSLLMEVAGSLRLFGGLAALLEEIRRFFTGRTVYRERPNLTMEYLQPLIAVAPVPAAALLLARNGCERVVRESGELRSVLGEVAVSGADITAKQVAELGRCGLDTLRDLWRLPQEDLGRRFGRELLEYLDRLLGVQPEPATRAAVTPRFRQRLTLPMDTRDSGMILLAAEKLLAAACRFLERHAAATEEVVFDLWHVHRGRGERGRNCIRIITARAGRRPDHFLAQLETRLERLGHNGAIGVTGRSGVRPQQRQKSRLVKMPETVEAISIRIDRVMPYQQDSQDLFRRRQEDQPEWDHLMDLLTARLGRAQVCRLRPVADHRPEQATDRHWAGEAPVESPVAIHCLQLPARPLWLLASPRPILRDPVLRDLLEAGDQALEDVPEVERIEVGWWERGDVRRDYMTAPAGRGALGWVFRDLGPVTGSGMSDHWYLHGLFG